MDSKRTFSKEEISKIFAKASKIQTQKDLYGDEQGLTQEELLRVAEEVGIDKDSLIEAIHSPDVPELDSEFNWITATSHIQDVQIVNGEITEESWEKVVQDIRRVTGGIGKLNTVGKSFEWEQRLKEIGYKHISLTPENGTTKIQFVSNWKGLKFLSTFLSFLAGAAITGIALDGTNFADIVYFLLPLLGGSIALGIGRFYLKSYFKKQKSIFKNIIHSVASTLNPKEESQIEIEKREATEEQFQAGINHSKREKT